MTSRREFLLNMCTTPLLGWSTALVRPALSLLPDFREQRGLAAQAARARFWLDLGDDERAIRLSRNIPRLISGLPICSADEPWRTWSEATWRMRWKTQRLRLLLQSPTPAWGALDGVFECAFLRRGLGLHGEVIRDCRQELLRRLHMHFENRASLHNQIAVSLYALRRLEEALDENTEGLAILRKNDAAADPGPYRTLWYHRILILAALDRGGEAMRTAQGFRGRYGSLRSVLHFALEQRSAVFLT